MCVLFLRTTAMWSSEYRRCASICRFITDFYFIFSLRKKLYGFRINMHLLKITFTFSLILSLKLLSYVYPYRSIFFSWGYTNNLEAIQSASKQADFDSAFCTLLTSLLRISS